MDGEQAEERVKRIKTKSCFCSWSGGKDSCLALYRARSTGKKVSFLLNMLTREGTRSRSHGLRKEILQAQSESLQIPLVTAATSWEDYEKNFIDLLRGLKESGISAGVFGDIDLEAHRQWEEKVCRAAGMEAVLPLWKTGRDELIREFLAAGFEAVLVAVREDVLDASFLGRKLTSGLAEEFKQKGIDASGENGEYHTVVIGGPGFGHRLKLEPGNQIHRHNHWVMDFKVSGGL